MARASCPKCNRLIIHCICALIRPLACRTQITLVQYPGEETHPLGTAALVQGALDCALLRTDALLAAPAWPDGTALLFPGEEASNLATLASAPPHLVVLDGTWRKALRLYEQSPALKALPKVCLPQGAVSRYRLRSTRKKSALSTVEAVMMALAIIEPGIDLSPLEDGFEGLIERAMTRLPASVRQQYL